MWPGSIVACHPHGPGAGAGCEVGQVKIRDVALDNSRWPDDVRKLSNNYDNQFQLPVLFYALLPLMILLVKVDWLTVALAWAFIASRIVHSLIHTGDNVVIRASRPSSLASSPSP